MPSSRTLEGRNTSYLDFDLKTERNSDFHTETLSEGELEMLGGTEYRALRWLTFVVPLVCAFFHLPSHRARSSFASRALGQRGEVLFLY